MPKNESQTTLFSCFLYNIGKGFLTCGISFAPAIVKSFKKALEDDNEVSLIDTEVFALDDSVSEETAQMIE